jgi:hypothetical protein
VYTLVVPVLLANGVLIALLTDTYESVRDQAYGESVRNRLSMLHEFMCKHSLPPPLTAPFILLMFLRGERDEAEEVPAPDTVPTGRVGQLLRFLDSKVEVVTSRESKLTLASDAEEGQDEKGNNLETQVSLLCSRGLARVCL